MRVGAQGGRRRHRKLRKSASVALGALLLTLLTISPSRAFCQSYTLDFANVPGEERVSVGPGAMIAIVGELWRTDCAADPSGTSGGGCLGLRGVERPLKNITVELVGEDDSVVIADGISAEGENETWVLNFRVPKLAPGTYRIHAYAEDKLLEATNDRLSLHVSREGPRGGPAAT